MTILSNRLAILIPVLLTAAVNAAPPIDGPDSTPSLSFEPNLGQTGAAVRYLARTPHGVVFFTDREIVLHRPGSSNAASDGTVRFELVGANAAAAWEPEERIAGSVSYRVGRDSSKWVSDVPYYGRLRHRGVYPGIDAVYYGSTGRLEYDFVLAPHADPSRIRIRAAGASSMTIGADGALVAETPQGQIRQHKPALYQTRPDGVRTEVAGAFRLIGRDEIGFTVSGHDPSLPLSIDPVLEASTYLGGSLEDRVVVNNGYTVVGMTTSIDFPGAEFGRRKGNDVFIRFRANPEISLVTGGTGNDEVTSVGLHNSGSVLIGGYTDSQDLPTTRGPFYWDDHDSSYAWQPDFMGGATDGFLLEVQDIYYGSGRITFLSYVGTTGDDRVTGMDDTGSAIVGTTTGRGIPEPPSQYYAPVQREPRGGLDGFLIVASSGTGEFQPWYTTYLGGSGDDRPLGVAFGSGGYYIAGETTSADFPLAGALSSKRSGTSDAFLTLIDPYSPKIVASTLIGGSKADRGVGVRLDKLSFGDVVVAGVTASPDLPLKNPLQSTYGGGASDVFVARFNRNLSQMLSNTYYGGAAADEATSIATDYLGNVFVAGWTSSGDLPVKNAVQSQFGGGPDDGFLIHIDPDRLLHAATYFGGSGSDRILGLSASSDFNVTLAGQTTSRDLPLRNAAQGELRGLSDGFFASISTNLISASRVVGAKDVRAATSIRLGPVNGGAKSPVTVISSDPGSVLVAGAQNENGTSSVTLKPKQNSLDYARTLYVDCLVDRGGADLTITAAGYPSKVIRADCSTAQLQVDYYSSGSGVTETTSGFSISAWAYPATIYAHLLATDPQNPSYVYSVNPRPGLSPVVVQVKNSNPATGTISASTLSITDGTSTRIQFQPAAAAGVTELTFTATRPNVSTSIKISVVSPATKGDAISIPNGFQSYLPLGLSGPNLQTNPKVTIKSQDPNKLVISTDPKQRGSGTVTLVASAVRDSTLYAQALASSGDVGITMSVPGFDPVTATVHLTSPLVYCSDGSVPLEVAIRGTAAAACWIGVTGSSGRFYSYIPNPGSTALRFTAESSAPAVASVSPASYDLTTEHYWPRFQVTGVAEGTAKLKLTPPQQIPLGAGVATSFQVIVKSKRMRMDSIDVGKDLAGQMVLRLPYAPTADIQVTLTTSDSSLALLSADNKSAGKSSLVLPIKKDETTLAFYIQGLRSAGVAKIAASVPGYGSISADVSLDPSGFGWTADTSSTILYSSNPSASITPFALDAKSMMPVAMQSLRSGVSATVKAASSNTNVVTLAGSYSLSSANRTAFVELTAKSSGTAVITIQQPAGFSTSVLRQKLSVTIQRPSLTLESGVLARDTQREVRVSGLVSKLNQNVKITSSDATKLLISTDPAKPGSGSVTIPMSWYQPLYVQALKNQGAVTLTASSEGFNNGTGTFRLVDLGVGLSVEDAWRGGSDVRDGVAYTTIQSGTTSITVSLYQVDGGTVQQLSHYSGFLRPGAKLPQVEVKSSNTRAGVIADTPTQLSLANGAGHVSFKPVAAGDTTVSVVQPQGFVAPTGYTSFPFRVSPPSFKTAYRLVSKDTFSSMSLDLADNVNTVQTNLTVTITSPDPSRVLLSRDASSPATASVTRTLVAGEVSTERFYVHALANNGIVPLKVSARGWNDGIANIALSDTVFSINRYGSTLRMVMQSGPQKLPVGFSASIPKNLPQGYYYTGNDVAIRPGAASIPVDIKISNASILTTDTPRIQFAPFATGAEFALRAVKIGTANVSVAVPSGYLASTDKLAVSVEAARLSSYYGGSPVGRDLQASASVNAENGFTKTTTVTFTSSDASRVLVSADAAAVGKRAATVTVQPNHSAEVWLQSLSDSGSATITAAAEGYQSTSFRVDLAPSAAVFDDYRDTINLQTNSPAQSVYVRLTTLDPSSLSPSCCATAPRPGTNLSVTLKSSNTKVATVAPATVQFTSKDPIPVTLKPAGAGTAIVSLGTLPNGIPPASKGSIVVNVTKPQ